MPAQSVNTTKLFLVVCAGIWAGTEAVHRYFDPAGDIIASYNESRGVKPAQTRDSAANDLIAKSLNIK